MKKGLTIGIALITTLSLAACGNSQTKPDKAKKDSSSLVAKKKAHAKKESIKKAKATSESKAKAESESKASSIAASSSSAASVATSQSQAAQSSSTVRAQQTSTSSTTAQADRNDPNTWNRPYKGYSSYNAYCEANNGDPEVQKETADIQESLLEQQGLANSDGSPTQKAEDAGYASDGSW